MKRILTLICALMFATALSFGAQDTTQTTTTTTHTSTPKSRRARHKKHQAHAAANNNADSASGDFKSAGSETEGAAKSTGHGIVHGSKAVGNKTKEGYEASKQKVTGDKETTTTTTTDNPHLQNIAFQSGAAATQAKPSASKGDKLDLNTASEADLDKLPGVGPAIAGKIIAGRPYSAKNQLMTKGILSQKQYDGLKDQVIAHRSSATPTKTHGRGTTSKS